MNKVIVIGGGVAGLATAIFLHRAGWNVTVKERANGYTAVGHGFILLPNGLEILEHLGIKNEAMQSGACITQYVNKTTNDIELINESLLDNLAIRRNELVSILAKCLPANAIHFGCKIQSLLWNKNQGDNILLCYENDQYEEADLVIGADGAHSVVRSLTFPEFRSVGNLVNEIVGVCSIPKNNVLIPNQLLKIQSEKGGAALGILHCSKQELIWYLQYDNAKYPTPASVASEIKDFVLSITDGWSSTVDEIFNLTDFDKVHVWRTHYMELLPSFHKKNIVLIGDAAHTFLPFTSQGANSALVDAYTFCNLIADHKSEKQNWEGVFNQYYQLRKEDIIKNIAFGKKMTELFLHPENKDELIVPLAIN